MGAPGLRLHKRTMPVQSATAELRLLLIKFQAEYDLTDIEMTGILVYAAADVNKYALRRERHPDDPDKKADEA
jgi:hypothetical protein